MAAPNRAMLVALHEEALACAIATLDAINAADYFGTVPADPDARDKHNHGCWLLAMLSDHLRNIDVQVDTLAEAIQQERAA